MNPMLVAQLVGMGAQVVGGIAAELIARGDRDQAYALLEEAARQSNVSLPQYQKLVAEQVGPSAFEDIQTDPRLQEAQYSALDALQGISDAGGMTIADQANLNRITNQTNRAAASQNAAVRNDMLSRGVGGSGAELAMQLQNNQAQAQRAADSGLDVAAEAQRRALDAIMARGQQAGQMRAQSFGEQARVADARDLINRYNAGARERATVGNNDLATQQYRNRQGAADRRAQASRDKASYYSSEAARKANMVGGVANSVAYGANGYGQHLGTMEEIEAQKKNGGGK